MWIYLENTTSRHAFYRLEVEAAGGSDYVCRRSWGKIGTRGQTKEALRGSRGRCVSRLNELLHEKMDRDYRPVEADGEFLAEFPSFRSRVRRRITLTARDIRERVARLREALDASEATIAYEILEGLYRDFVGFMAQGANQGLAADMARLIQEAEGLLAAGP